MNIAQGVIFGLLAMFFYGVGNAIAKVPISQIGSRKTIFFRNTSIVVILLSITLIFRDKITLDPMYIGIAALVGIAGYVPMFYLFKAIKVGKLGVIMPVANSSVIFTILLSIIFYSETLSITQIVAVMMIIAGIIIYSIDFKDLKNSHLFKLSSGLPYALVTCVGWGFFAFLFKIPVTVLGPILTSLILESVVLISSFIHLKGDIKLPRKTSLAPLIMNGVFGAFATLSFALGVQVSLVSIVAAITGANPLIAALYGIIFYKEKLDIKQWIALPLTVTGIIIIAL